MLAKDDLLEVVVADLMFLRDEWDENVDDHSLRRSSTVLRRLLVDNELQRAWKAAGFDKEPTVHGSTLRPILQRVSLETISFASAGGARYKGTELRGALMTNYAMSPEELGAHQEAGVPSAALGLRAFIEGTCVVVKGHHVPRRTLIKYVSNKLGGAHHDSKRGNTEEEILFSRLDKARQVVLLDKPLVYFELLSIGQALTSSPDMTRLVSALAPNSSVPSDDDRNA